MKIKTFSDFVIEPLVGFVRKNTGYISTLDSGNVIISISQNQISGILKPKNGEEIKLKKVTIKYQ